MAAPINAQEKFMRELVFLMQLEETYGQKPSSFSPTAIPLKDVDLSPMEADSVDRSVATGFLGADPSDVVNKRVSLSGQFDQWMLGVDRLDNGEAPPHSALFRACGFTETITGPDATVADSAEPQNSPAGSFTYTQSAPFQQVLDRTVTLECTTAGGSGTAEFKVTAPERAHLAAYEATGQVMTDDTAFPLVGGAEITPTVGTTFEVGDTFTIDLRAPGVTYQPVTGGTDSIYGQAFLSDDLHPMPGIRGALGWTVEANSYLDMPIALTGMYQDPEEGTPPGIDFSAFQEPVPVSPDATPSFMLGGEQWVMRSFSIDAASGEPSSRQLVNQKKIVKPERQPSGNLVVQAPRVADRNILREIARSEARLPFELVHGLDRGGTLVIEGPNLELRSPQQSGDDDEVAALEMSATPLPVNGDDEFKIHLR